MEELHEESVTPYVLTKEIGLPPNQRITIQEAPISINHMYGISKFGRKFVKADGKEYKLKVATLGRESGCTPTKKRCVMEIIYYFGDNRKRDVDNYSKPILDSLQGVAYDNDNQIKDLTLRVRHDKENPRTEVKIWELNDA